MVNNKKEKIFFLCDFETTGVDYDTDVGIELGGVFLFENFTPGEYFHSLINPFGEDKKEWEGREKEAFAIHRIPFEHIVRFGKRPAEVIRELEKKMQEVKQFTRTGEVEFIVLSDNAVFEYTFLRKLYKQAGALDRFPFHYKAWDTNLLFFLFPEIESAEPAHRALPDALRVFEKLRKISVLKQNNR